MQPNGDAVVAKLTVFLHGDGHVSVNGPCDQKVLCYGILQSAIEAIQKFDLSKAHSPILIAAAVPRMNGVVDGGP